MQRWQVAGGRYFAPPDEPGVVVGSAIAQQFALRPGDTFTVRSKPLPALSALQSTGTKDDIASFIPSATVERIYDVEGKGSARISRTIRSRHRSSAPVPALDGATIAYVLAFSVALSLLAGLYPAWRAARLSPLAIRNV